jgi:hypothetical protein
MGICWLGWAASIAGWLALTRPPPSYPAPQAEESHACGATLAVALPRFQQSRQRQVQSARTPK